MIPRRYRNIRCYLIALSFSTMTAGPALAQGRFVGGFEREINRYRWTSDIQFDRQIDAWTVELSNSFRSDAFILFDDRLSFRDENNTRLTLRRPYGERRLSIYGSFGWFSLSRVLSQNLIAGYRFPLTSKVWFEPLLGASLDRRPGFSEGTTRAPLRTDAGPAAGFKFGVPSTAIDAYRVEVSGEGLIQSMAPRRGEMLRASGFAERTFEKTRVRTRVQVARIRRDAYEAASFLNRDDTATRVAETVESTRSDTLAATVFVDRTVSQSTVIRGRLDFTTNRRMVETLRAPESAIFFDSDFSRRVFEAELSSTYSKSQTLLRLSIRGGAEVERRRLANEEALPPAQASQKLNLLKQADYDRGFLSFQMNARAPIGSRAVLQADISVNILRRDTPDVNPDDRDELYYNGLLGASLHLTRHVELQLQLFGTYYHTVYVKAARSIENNVQQSLRFRPTIIWRPSPVTRINVTTEVRANYTIDDFLLPGRLPTDQSARELSYNLDGEHDFGHSVRLYVKGRLSDLRLGRFLNDSFAEIPIDSLRTTSAWIRLSVGGKVQAEIGLRTYIRSDFDRAITVRYDRGDASGMRARITRPGRQIIAQVGPTTSIVWPLTSGRFLRLDGWATFQRISYKLYGELPEGLESEIKKAAKKGSRTLIPNLSVTMQWQF